MFQLAVRVGVEVPVVDGLDQLLRHLDDLLTTGCGSGGGGVGVVQNRAVLRFAGVWVKVVVNYQRCSNMGTREL